MSKIIPGLYKHFKGSYYSVIGTVKHSETLEELVIYKSSLNGEMWVRPIESFTSLVEVNGEKEPRFKFMTSADLSGFIASKNGVEAALIEFDTAFACSLAAASATLKKSEDDSNWIDDWTGDPKEGDVIMKWRDKK